ncbi:DinB family protein [Spirosoma sp. SC4-14]|uniref:DinB family protein n=1 Tax=Spirosoma sp. SC4-14 TaxID=3128900 RepID=UPI0030D55872
MNRYRVLIDYTIRANQVSLTQVRNFSQSEFEKELGGSFPSLKLTFRHLLESDYLWLKRWQGEPLSTIPSDWNTETAESLAAIWQPLQQAIQTYSNGISANQLDEIVQFTTRTGKTFSLPLWQTISHVANHGTYHRGQITNMVRMLGHKPVNTDLFAFYNEQNQLEQTINPSQPS